jgi:hypothetical protein
MGLDPNKRPQNWDGHKPRPPADNTDPNWGTYAPPAPRYDLFIKAFEKHVAGVQAQIEQVRGMERTYNIARTALEAAKLPNEIRLTVSGSNVKLDIQATNRDCQAIFAPLIEDIGKRLLDAGLHKDGEPAKRDGGMWHELVRYWNLDEGAKQVRIEIAVPREGMRDLKWKVIDRPTTYQEYTAIGLEVENPNDPLPVAEAL